MTKISYSDAIKIAFISGFVGILIFLMIQVLMAQVLLDTVILFIEDENFLIIFIIMVGFVISLIISIIAGYMASDLFIEKKYVIASSILTFLSNFLIWVFISYIYIGLNYPEIFEDLTVIQRIVIFPSVIGYFSIYYLENVVFLWIYSQVTYSILFMIFLKGLGSQQTKRTRYGYNR